MMEGKVVAKITNVEIPVSDLETSIKWYTELLGLHIQHQGSDSAMLSFHTPGTANIFLMQTEDPAKLVFRNTTWGIEENSIIDFYAEDLHASHQWLKEQGVKVSDINGSEDGLAGFGVTDPDGHTLGICNEDHDKYIPKKKREAVRD